MDPARSLLATLQSHAQAPKCIKQCLLEIQTHRGKLTPTNLDVVSNELADKIIEQFETNFKIIDASQAAQLKPYLIIKAKKHHTDLVKFSSLGKLLGKMEKKKLLDETAKDALAPIKKERDKNVAAANDYLSQAQPALRAATSTTELKKELDATVWDNLKVFLKDYTFDKTPNSKAGFSVSIQSLSDPANFGNIEKALKTYTGKKPEAENFFANLGAFLAEISPYYNALWAFQDQIQTQRKEKATGQFPITKEICNAFLRAGQAKTIVDLPKAGTPITIPAFTKTTTAPGTGTGSGGAGGVGAPPPPPPSKDHPLTALSKAQTDGAKVANFLTDIEPIRKRFQADYDQLGPTMGYDSATKNYVPNPTPGSPQELPADAKAAEKFRVEVLEQQSEAFVQRISERMEHHKLINAAERKELQPYLLELAQDFEDLNHVQSKPLARILKKLEDQKIPSPVDLQRVEGIKKQLDGIVREANVYYKQALAQLKNNTTIPTLQTQMYPDLLQPIEELLNSPGITQPLLRNAALGVVGYIAGNFKKIEAEIDQESKQPDYAKKTELKNFYANFGKFLEQFGPYFNGIFENINDIRKIEGDKPINVTLTPDVCNVFLSAGGAPTISNLPATPTNPPTIPKFTPVAALTPPPPPPNPPVPPNPPAPPVPGKNPVPPTDPKAPAPAPAAKTTEKIAVARKTVKENRFVTVILWLPRQIGSFFSSIWNWLTGKKVAKT